MSFKLCSKGVRQRYWGRAAAGDPGGESTHGSDPNRVHGDGTHALVA